MLLKGIGALLIVVGCASVGIRLANAHRKEEHTLRRLIAALDYMECELQYRLLPLPELCRQTANVCDGVLQGVFAALADELDAQAAPDVALCLRAVLARQKQLPEQTEQALCLLGNSLGRFDLEGQLTGLETVRGECRAKLGKLTANGEVRIRSYQTLGLCAGAALAILLL